MKKLSFVPILSDMMVFWKSIVIVLTPFILLPLPLVIGTDQANCAYAVILMAIYWMTEVVTLAVTSFIPVFLFPFLGVLTAKETCAAYLKDTNFLFVAGLIVALGVEESNLHKRIALRVLIVVGSRPRSIMLGFMVVTAFLSMWMSNTATTAMMVPIAVTVLDEIAKHDKLHTHAAKKHNNMKVSYSEPQIQHGPNSTWVILDTNIDAVHPISTEASQHHHATSAAEHTNKEPDLFEDYTVVTSNGKFKINELSEFLKGICKAIMLGICYAANIGGTGTLTGTGPNLVLKGQLDSFYPGQRTGVTFASWMGFAIPPLILCLLLAWIWLQIACMGLKNFLSCFSKSNSETAARDNAIKNALLYEYRRLGTMSFAEKSMLLWFILLVALWIFQDPQFIPGWNIIFKPKYVSSSSPGMLIACILFAWPRDRPDFLCFRKDKKQRAKSSPPILTWAAMQKKFPWSVIMLLGGGFALAEGVKASGLDKWVGCSLQTALGNIPTAAIISIFTIIITFITEVSSNTATASIFIPILLAAATNLKINPLMLALPGTIAPSFAFMVPVATPPNAIVYETGAVRMIDMMIIGFVMNWLCIGVTLLNINTYAVWYFNLNVVPQWSFAANSTVDCS